MLVYKGWKRKINDDQSVNSTSPYWKTDGQEKL